MQSPISFLTGSIHRKSSEWSLSIPIPGSVKESGVAGLAEGIETEGEEQGAVEEVVTNAIAESGAVQAGPLSGDERVLHDGVSESIPNLPRDHLTFTVCVPGVSVHTDCAPTDSLVSVFSGLRREFRSGMLPLCFLEKDSPENGVPLTGGFPVDERLSQQRTRSVHHVEKVSCKGYADRGVLSGQGDSRSRPLLCESTRSVANDARRPCEGKWEEDRAPLNLAQCTGAV